MSEPARSRRASRAAHLALVCALALAPRVTRAQSAPPPPPPGVAMTLDQARALSAEHAPDVIVSAARASVAVQDVRVAGMLTNPTLTLGGAIATAHFYTVVSVPLPIFGQRQAAVDAAEALAQAARRDIDVTRIDVRLATTSAWVDLWLAEQEAAIASETADRSARLLAATEERFATGTAPRLDVLRARSETLRLRADAEALTRLAAGASARLSVWLGRPAAEAPALHAAGDPPATPAALPALPRLLERVDRHPAFLAARAREHAADANVALERRRRWPLVGVEVGGAFLDPSLAAAPGQPPPTLSDGHVALSFEIPVFNLHGPLIARAQTALEQSTLEARVARTRVAADVASAYAALDAATGRARAQREDVLPATREAADLALEGYQSGRGDITSVLTAQQALVDARLTDARLEADRVRALANLEHAVGGAL